MHPRARENILKRIRQNLKIQATRGALDEQTHPPFEAQSSVQRSEHIGMTPSEIFEKELTLVGGNVKQVFSREDLYASILDICQKENYRNIALSRETFIEELGLEKQLSTQLTGAKVAKASAGSLVGQLQHADVGITACEFLAAETGTIILRASTDSPRTISLLPRAHVVVAKEEQLLPTVALCFDRLRTEARTPALSSCITLITGQSRTADIEKVLVKGVHGPKDLYVFIMATVK